MIIHEEDRKKYFDALESWDSRQELELMKNFLQEQSIKKWAKNLQMRSSYNTKFSVTYIDISLDFFYNSSAVIRCQTNFQEQIRNSEIQFFGIILMTKFVCFLYAMLFWVQITPPRTF